MIFSYDTKENHLIKNMLMQLASRIDGKILESSNATDFPPTNVINWKTCKKLKDVARSYVVGDVQSIKDLPKDEELLVE